MWHKKLHICVCVGVESLSSAPLCGFVCINFNHHRQLLPFCHLLQFRIYLFMQIAQMKALS